MRLVVAGMQHAGTACDVEANLAALDDAAAHARVRGADLLVTPEMFLSGYNVDAEALVRLADEDLVARAADVARRHGIGLAVGMPERAGPRGLWNSVVLLDHVGNELTRYRKSHLFGDLDRRLFVAGDDAGTPVTVQGVQVSLMICYDVEFPEMVRRAALLGADVVLVPTAQMEPYAHVAERLLPVRAWENQVYLVYADRIGAEGDLSYVGRSSIVAPSGEFLDLADGASAGLVVGVVDTEVVSRARRANPYLRDVRPELYASYPTAERAEHP